MGASLGILRIRSPFFPLERRRQTEYFLERSGVVFQCHNIFFETKRPDRKMGDARTIGAVDGYFPRSQATDRLGTVFPGCRPYFRDGLAYQHHSAAEKDVSFRDARRYDSSAAEPLAKPAKILVGHADKARRAHSAFFRSEGILFTGAPRDPEHLCPSRRGHWFLPPENAGWERTTTLGRTHSAAVSTTTSDKNQS